MDIVINRCKEKQYKNFNEIPVGSLFMTESYAVYLKISYSGSDLNAVNISTGNIRNITPYENVKVYYKTLELNEEHFE